MDQTSYYRSLGRDYENALLAAFSVNLQTAACFMYFVLFVN
jgi:hypothetical protein